LSALGEVERRELALLLEEWRSTEVMFEAEVEKDPFYYFQPSSGVLDEHQKAFLRKWLKEEDVPDVVDGQLEALVDDHDINLTAGGNQCLGGEAEIYDPVYGGYRRVGEIRGCFHVLSWDGEKVVPAVALEPFVKSEDDIYEFTLSNGESFPASLGHLVLTRTGYLSLRRVVDEGLRVLSPTISGTCLSVLPEDGLRSLRTEQGFRSYCPSCRRLYGGRSLSAGDTYRCAFPLQGDVLGRRGLAFSRMDVLGNSARRIRSCQCEFHPSSPGALGRSEAHVSGTLFHSFCRPCESALDSHPTSGLFWHESDRQSQPTCEFHQQAKHSDNRFSPCDVPPVSSLVVTKVTYLRRDVKYDFTVPGYHNYLLAGAVHHNSGKSTLSSIEDAIDICKVVPVAMDGIYPKSKIPEKVPFSVRVVGVDHTQLLNTVIPAYRRWIPRGYLIKGSWDHSFSSERRLLTLQRGRRVYGTIEFMTNQMEVEKFQGPPLDKVNYDEEPRQDIYRENLLRFVTAKRLRVRFRMTPTRGLTWVKSEILDREGEPGSGIRCFKLASVCNPKANMKVLEGILGKLDSYEERKMRLLGSFVSLSGLVYGNLFNRKEHVVEPFPIDYENYVVYRGGDPHLVKPSVFVEVAVDREGICYVIGVYSAAKDTAEIKADLAERARTRGKDERGWRLGQTRVDRSCNSTVKVLGDRNIFLELSRGQNAIPAMVTSDKFVGSINAGVDVIKQMLKEKRLFFFDTPEVWTLIKAMESLEREMGANEDKKGIRDVIAEGRWDAHAALRYIFQGPVRWIPVQMAAPEPAEERYI